MRYKLLFVAVKYIHGNFCCKSKSLFSVLFTSKKKCMLENKFPEFFQQTLLYSIDYDLQQIYLLNQI